MPVSYNTFEHLKDKGLADFKSGDYKAAKPYLMQGDDLRMRVESGSFQVLDPYCEGTP